MGDEKSEEKKGGAVDFLAAWRRPGARVWLVTTSLTMAVLTVAGSAIYWKHTDSRARLEGQYSRLSAHFAEEADLRIKSYQRVASVIGSVTSWRNAALDREAKAKVVDDALKRSDVATKVASTAQANKAALFSAAIDVITRANAAREETKSATEALGAANRRFAQASDELQQKTEDVNRTAGQIGAAQVGVMSAVPPGDGGPTEASNQAQARAAQALQAARQKNATALQEQVTAKKKYDEALALLNGARTAADSARQSETIATTAETEAIKTFSAADRAAAIAAAKKNDARQFVATSRKEFEDLVEADERSRPSFLPPSKACEGSPDPGRCYAESVAEPLFSGPLQSLPKVVPCPVGARAATYADSSVLLEGRAVLFPIGDTGQSEAHRPSDTKGEGPGGGDGHGQQSAVDPKQGPPQGRAAAPAAAPDAELCLRVPMSEIAPLAHGRASGEAYVESAPGELLLVDGTTCQVLEWSDTDRQARPVLLPGCSTAMLPKAEPSSGPSEKEPSKSDGDADRSERPAADLDIGGQRYRGFWQPLRSQFRCAGGETGGVERTKNCEAVRSLVVVNLVREDRLVQQMRGLSPLTFLALVAFAALSIFSWPIAKLWLVGASSRFSRFDSAFLATSALAGTFIIVLVGLALVARERLTRRADDQLAALATELSTRLQDAMTNASKNLDIFEEKTVALRTALVAAGPSRAHDFRVADEIAAACHSLDGGGRDWQWPHPEDGKVLWPLCETKSTGRMTVGRGPNTSVAFWVNSRGYEQIQERDDRAGTPPVNVSGRDYFIRARESCEVKGEPSNVAEVVRSLTSTKKVLLVARASSCVRGTDGTNESAVSGFETGLDRFEHLSLPPGVQWAAVDATGKVMLHSSMNANHLHDVYDDFDDGTTSRVRSAIFSRSSAPFDGEYRGVRSRIRVDPSPVTGWSVITFVSRAQNEAITRDTLVTTAASYSVFVLLVALVAVAFALGRIGKTHEPVFDPFPRADASRTYAAVAAQLALGGVALLIATLACPWIPTIVLLIATAWLLVVCARQVPGVWPSVSLDSGDASGLDERTQVGPDSGQTETYAETPIRRIFERLKSSSLWKRLSLTYALCCFFFAVTFVVVPTAVCFVGAFSLAAQSALRAEQRAIAALPGCVTAGGDKCRKVVPNMEPRRVSASGTPDSISPYLSAGALWPLEPLMASIHSDYLEASRRSGAAQSEKKSQPQLLRVASADIDGAELESTLPRLFRNTNWRHLMFGGVCVALFLLLAHAVAYASLKRLFFMDTLVDWLGSHSKVPPASDSARVLYLYPPPGVVAGLDESDTTSVLLREADPWSAPGQMIARVLAAKRVLAEVDPLRRGPPEFRGQWAEALKDFVVIEGSGRPPMRHVGNRAAFAYQWNISDSAEQKVLAQLALDGHACPHPGNEAVLRHLVARGLVDGNTLRIAEPGFATYLEQSITPEQMKAWQEDEKDVVWDVIRIPLVTSVALVLLVVLMSHPELAESGALLLPPAAGGLPAVLRFVAMLGRKGRGAEASV